MCKLVQYFQKFAFHLKKKITFWYIFCGVFWVVFKENLTPEQNVQRCTWWTSVFVFFCFSLCWLKSQFFNWMWWSSMLPFSSLPSCVTVWVEERCLWIYFTHFNFVVLVRRKTQFLDKRALKKKKCPNWFVVGDVGWRNTRLKKILLSDFNVHCVLYSTGNFCSLWTFLLKKTEQKKISNCIVQRDVIFLGVLEMHKLKDQFQIK